MLLGLYAVSSRIGKNSIDGQRTSLLRALLAGGDGRECFGSPSMVLAPCVSARRAFLRRVRCGRFSIS